MFPEFHLKEIVKDNVAEFSHYRSGVLYYTVTLTDKDSGGEQSVWQFPVPCDDLQGAPVFADMKAITLMRWIRKALEAQPMEFIRTKDKARRRFNVTYREGKYKVSIPCYDGGAVVEAREIK